MIEVRDWFASVETNRFRTLSFVEQPIPVAPLYTGREIKREGLT